LVKEEVSKLGKRVSARKVKAGAAASVFTDVIPSELLMTVILNDRAVSTVSCSPENLTEFTVGYLLNNGYVDSFSDINILKICSRELNGAVTGNELSVQVNVKSNLPARPNGKDLLQSGFFRFVSSACGSLDDLIMGQRLQKIKSTGRFDSKTVLKLNTEAAASQKFKKELGGLHSAALFDSTGKLIVLMEDIGRHNCIDKIAGFMQIKRIEPADKIVYTTGRISIDVVFKMTKMRVPVLVSNSSVTHSAVFMAKKSGLTLVGYARGGRFNIYSWPERIVAS